MTFIEFSRRTVGVIVYNLARIFPFIICLFGFIGVIFVIVSSAIWFEKDCGPCTPLNTFLITVLGFYCLALAIFVAAKLRDHCHDFLAKYNFYNHEENNVNNSDQINLILFEPIENNSLELEDVELGLNKLEIEMP